MSSPERRAYDAARYAAAHPNSRKGNARTARRRDESYALSREMLLEHTAFINAQAIRLDGLDHGRHDQGQAQIRMLIEMEDRARDLLSRLESMRGIVMHENRKGDIDV